MTIEEVHGSRRVAVLIPAFNEAPTIGDLVRRVRPFVEKVIVVDDGSTDDTAALVRREGAELVQHPQNLGKGPSLLSGFAWARRAGYELVVTLDGDGQHRPEDVPKLLALADHRTIVVGSRAVEAHRIPKARYRANQTANFFISWAAGAWISDTQSGFRVYPLAVLNSLSLSRERGSGFVLESEVLIEACRAGFRVVTAPIPALYEGVLKRPSYFRPVRDIAAIVMMVGGKILAWGLYPAGYIKSRRQRRSESSQI